MKTFLKDDTGAVTVDWVVLTAALVGLGLATMTVVSSGVEATATDIDEELTSQLTTTSFASDFAYSYIDAARGEQALSWYASELASDVQETQSVYQQNLEFLREAIDSGDLSEAQHELDYLIAAHELYGDGSNPNMDLAALAQAQQATLPDAYADLDQAYAAFQAEWPDT